MSRRTRKLRSRAWFDNSDMTVLYIGQDMNFDLSQEELQSEDPIIGITQICSGLSPCNRRHIAINSYSQPIFCR